MRARRLDHTWTCRTEQRLHSDYLYSLTAPRFPSVHSRLFLSPPPVAVRTSLKLCSLPPPFPYFSPSPQDLWNPHALIVSQEGGNGRRGEQSSLPPITGLAARARRPGADSGGSAGRRCCFSPAAGCCARASTQMFRLADRQGCPRACTLFYCKH